MTSAEIEVAVPTFLRPHINEILSIGKSVRLIKELDR
jgi:hypothetical protein